MTMTSHGKDGEVKNKSFFFYGVVDGESITADTWQALHEHFEKLMKNDKEIGYEATNGKGAKHV